MKSLVALAVPTTSCPGPAGTLWPMLSRCASGASARGITRGCGTPTFTTDSYWSLERTVGGANRWVALHGYATWVQPRYGDWRVQKPEAGYLEDNIKMMGGHHRKSGDWPPPRRGSGYVYDVLKALVIQLCLEVVRRWL